MHVDVISYLQQGNVKKSKKLRKIVNIEDVKSSYIPNVFQKQDFTISVENTFFKNPQGGVSSQSDPQPFKGWKYYSKWSKIFELSLTNLAPSALKS